jgi:hypothetical protein
MPSGGICKPAELERVLPRRDVPPGTQKLFAMMFSDTTLSLMAHVASDGSGRCRYWQQLDLQSLSASSPSFLLRPEIFHAAIRRCSYFSAWIPEYKF